jgi:redox-sensitive bicupin YhaK (pirin superfamily)
MSQSPIVTTIALGAPPWPTLDPFLFCVHHADAYPAGNDALGPAAPLTGRDLGQDFAGIDGWRMYHGQRVPGFPQLPHRGFETVTVVRRGLIDHSDSLGATARFGEGDTQHLTAGKGIVHCEMFPLLRKDAPNPAELFQIWMNLPGADKMCEPHFSMLWSETIPRHEVPDAEGRVTRLTTVYGAYAGRATPPPPPHSWANRPHADVAIWTLALPPGGRFTLPAAANPGGQKAPTHRVLYFFEGAEVQVADRRAPVRTGFQLRADADVALFNPGAVDAELLLLQGRPIGEPVAQYGPFVMNTQAEIQQAFADYRRTEFGGWPWPSDDPVHPREAGRFAIHADKRRETPPGA